MQNKKKKKIIFVSLLILLIFFGIWFFFFNKSREGGIVDSVKNLFPFGKIEIGQPEKIKGNQQTQENQEQKTEEIVTPKRKAGPRLRQINNFPTGGFLPDIRTEDKDIVDITINSDGTKTETEKTIQVQNNYVRYSSIDDATIYDSKVDPYEISHEVLVESYIPNAEQAVFSKDGNSVIFQYWNNEERTPETYLAHISKLEPKVEECPYDFSKPIKLGDNNDNVFNLHKFLNKNPLTRIAITGENSPGNETSIAVPATITAIKNFQSLYDLDIDGELGPATREKMLDICNGIQLKKAEEKFKTLKRKYKISGSFLPKGIMSVDVNPEGDKFFYIEKDKIGTIGVVKSFIDDESNTVFESTYLEWLADWNSKDSIELTTKASYLSDGFTYHLNPIDGDYHKSFKQKKGLTVLASPNNHWIFIHEIKDGQIKNSIFNRISKRFMKIPSIQTFPEKCTWTHDSKKLYCLVPKSMEYKDAYPDTWYQGLESYTDSLYKIDSRTGKTDLVSDFQNEYGESLDISKIGIDKNDEYLYFIDKKTEFLWSYRLIDA